MKWGEKIDPLSGKTTLKRPSLIRVKRITTRHSDHVSSFCVKSSQTVVVYIYTPLTICIYISLTRICRLTCIPPSILDVSRKKIEWWWWIVFVAWLADERCLTLFPAGTIARDPRYLESPTHREQDLNLRRTWVRALLNDVVR